MAQKFDRNFKLVVDANQSEGSTVSSLIGPRQSAGSITILPPFSLQFSVNRNNLASASNASLTIYNLNEDTRRKLQKDVYENYYRGIDLWAGYGDGAPTPLQAAFQTPAMAQIADEQARLFPLIFSGDVRSAWSERNGVDFLTHIDCYDGGYARRNGFFEGPPYAAGTPIKQVILDVIAAMPGITVGLIGDFPGTLPRKQSFSGNPSDIIQGFGGNFFIDSQKAYVLKSNEYLQGPVSIISSDSGLLAVPQKNNTLVTVRMIFEPGLRIGQRVELDTTTTPWMNGPYKVTGIHHEGLISDSVCGTATTTATITNQEVLTSLVS